MTTVSDIFKLTYGHSLELNRLELSTGHDAVNFVGRAAKNNGVVARVRPIPELEPAAAGSVTVALGGQGGAGTAYLQPFPFYCGRDVMVLTPKLEMSEKATLWWVACISANRFRFGFGRQANRTLGELVVPALDSVPAWVENCDLERFKGIDKPASPEKPIMLSKDGWANFTYQSLFDIRKGKRLTKSNMIAGTTPFIGAIDGNNGYSQSVAAEPNHSGNTITVNYNGSVAEAFYQPAPYWASDDVNVLYPKFDLNQYIGLFLCAVIRKERFRFSYGRKWHLDRMKESILCLPATKGAPDWGFMDTYIKSLPFSNSV